MGLGFPGLVMFGFWGFRVQRGLGTLSLGRRVKTEIA